MSTTTRAPARDLDADLAICEAETKKSSSQCKICSGTGYVEVCHDPYLTASCFDCFVADLEQIRGFAAAAREGWPYAIRRAMAAEAELDRIRDENAMLQEQLQQQHHRSHCYD